MPQEGMQLRPSFHIPHLGSVIHRASSNGGRLWVEAQADDFGQMAAKGVEAFTCVSIPEFAGFIEAPSDDLVAVWVVERDSVDDILVSF